MSLEHQTEQAPQGDVASKVDEREGDVQGLPPHLYQQVMAVRPGDEQGLAYLLSLFPPYKSKIVAVASKHLGLAAVQRAIRIDAPRHAQGQGGALSADELQELGLHEPAAQPEQGPPAQPAPTSETTPADTSGSTLSMMALDGPPLREDVRAAVLALKTGDAKGLQQLLNLYPSMSDAILTVAREHLGVETVAEAVDQEHHLTKKNNATAKAHAPESGDLSMMAVVSDNLPGAAAYNEAHPELVAEFNKLTHDVYVSTESDSTHSVDPLKVARWQAHRGLTADGKVGPHTVAAARHESATAVAQLDPGVDRQDGV